MEFDYNAVQLPPLQDAAPDEQQLAWRRRAASELPWQIRRALPMPRHLYKYMNFTDSAECIRNLRCIAVESNFWLSSPADFNDPYDFQCTVELSEDRTVVRKAVERIAADIKKNSPMTSKGARNLVAKIMANPEKLTADQSVFQRDRANHGVTCLTPDPRNLLMWSHYAASHRGICLQFRTDADPGIFAAAIDVDYCDEYPRVHWPKINKTSAVAYMLRKGTPWSYEKEKRIVFLGLRSRTLPLEPRALRGIILGCKFGDSDRQVLQSILDERQARGHPPVAIYRAHMHPSRYALVHRRDRA